VLYLYLIISLHVSVYQIDLIHADNDFFGGVRRPRLSSPRGVLAKEARVLTRALSTIRTWCAGRSNNFFRAKRLPISRRASRTNAEQGYDKSGGGEKRITPPTAGRVKSKQNPVETEKENKSPEHWRSRP